LALAGLSAATGVAGCGPHYREMRGEGQRAMIAQAYGPARILFQRAEELRPRQVENLHDLGACSVMLAREKFEQGNHAAAMRELDDAVAYYGAAIEVNPGHRASLEGKNVALKLKGQFDEALRHAEWAARFVGPSAQQYVFLARELEQRGDYDGALLRYRQAVAVEPNNADAHIAIAKFLIRNNNASGAVPHLQAAYRIDPLNAWVEGELAQRGALPALTRAADTAP
jgi:tetratricopeptide (TPR) repeat protein